MKSGSLGARRLARHPYPLALCLGVLALAACNSATDERGASQTGALTYWQDMLPLFETHCLRCHREGGIAPMRLDRYQEAKRFAAQIAEATSARRMPPWPITSDGSCGEFSGSLALSEDEITRIRSWVESGAAEGRARSIELPELPSLPAASELTTPKFLPEIQGGELAESDEYRCFSLASPSTETSFITGYEVRPGRPEIVHHVLLQVVDPDAKGEDGSGRNNAEIRRALDAASPERAGWPCFSGAGDGVSVESTPVVWAPGQGVVQYPGESGVALLPTRTLVVQIHYNLADPALRGLDDQTTLRLQLASHVPNLGIFALIDPFLDSLEDAQPFSLPPEQSSTQFAWSKTGADLGVDAQTTLQWRGVMPHMHQLGHAYRLTFSADGEEPHCAADVQDWDFHWQRMYFFRDPQPFGANSKVSVTCDYDTSSVHTPVTPGWGTRNEMCLATLYLTLPLDQIELK